MIVWLLVIAITLLTINVLGNGGRHPGGETVIQKTVTEHKSDRLPPAPAHKTRRKSDVHYIEMPATTILRIPVYGKPHQ